MKKIKMLFALLMTTVMVLTGCGNTDTQNSISNESSVTTLNNIWKLFEGDDVFPTLGGDINNMVEDAPGQYDLSYTDGLVYQMYISENDVAKISDMASLMHAMNSNTFTGAVVKLNDSADRETVISDIKDNVNNAQWMCGTPEMFLIASTADNDIVYAFGETSILNNFKVNFEKAYPNGIVIYYDVISEF